MDSIYEDDHLVVWEHKLSDNTDCFVWLNKDILLTLQVSSDEESPCPESKT